MLQSYTSTMSHEFRTPLCTILTMLETFRSKLKDPEQIRLNTLIISQLNLLLCLVQDVLDLKGI